MPSFVELNGTALRYDLSGEGPGELVLIHELGGSLDSFEALLALLPRTSRVLSYDVRGAGLSEKVGGRLDIDVLCDDLAALMAHAGMRKPATILGAAIGGSIAVRHAIRFPDLVEGLALVGPALGVPAERRDAALALADRVEREGLRAIAADLIPRAFPEALWAAPVDKTVALARWLGADPRGYAAAYRMLALTDVRAMLGDIGCPVLMLAGRHDPFGTPDILSAASREIPDCRFQVVEGGHFMHVQTPTLVAAALTAFLATSRDVVTRSRRG